MKKIIALVLGLILLLCCSQKQADTPAFHPDRKQEHALDTGAVVLINVGDIDRCEVGKLIDAVSKCRPKIVGINVLFSKEQTDECDTLLRRSIVDSDKVVLVESYHNGSRITSAKLFSDGAFLTGISGLIQNNDGIFDSYYRLTDEDGRWELSFPFLLALQNDKNRAAELASKATPKDYPIVFHRRTEDFKISDYSRDRVVNCDLIADRIVILGYLGPTDEDLLSTVPSEMSGDKTYGTVIIANLVIDILKDLE